MLTVYYDGWCPVCTATAERLRRLDWLGRLSLQSMRAPGAAESAGVPAERLAARLHVRDERTGLTLEGIWAAVELARRLPLLIPLWPLLALSGWLGVGQWAYDQIASRRTIVPAGGCEDGACPIHSPRSDKEP